MPVSLKYILFLLLVVMGFCRPLTGYAATGEKPILMICSYNPGAYPTSANVSDFMDEYERLGGKRGVVIENMNCKSFSDFPRWKGVMRDILDKYRGNQEPALIILFGQEAWASYLSLNDSVTGEVPVLCALTSRNVVLLPDDEKDLAHWMPKSSDFYEDNLKRQVRGGFMYEYDIASNIRMIRAIYPDTKEYGVSEAFMRHFAVQYGAVEKFVSKKIGVFTEDLSTRPAYFGSSAFIDFIHSLQLDISGADISFAAPLSFDAQIKKGDIRVSDMFNLYKYENMLYVMKLSGKEIKDFLEESYYMWTNQMKSPEDHLLWLKEKRTAGAEDRASFQNFSFNFDSAAGIIYTVDVTKPKGEKVTIVSMADGAPFRMDHIYKVALNSYRGNGGGELLTKGSGIPQEKLKERIIFSTDKDLRFYLMQYIEKKGTLNPRALNQWKFIPEEWVKPAAERDYEYLFGTK